MSAAAPAQAPLSPAFARWYRIGLPLAADDVLAAAWVYQHEAERAFWAEVDAAQLPHAPASGKAAYEIWRAAVPDFVCNMPAGKWEDLPWTIQAGFNAIAAPEPQPALWECEFCPAKFAHLPHAEAHALTEHPDAMPYEAINAAREPDTAPVVTEAQLADALEGFNVDINDCGFTAAGVADNPHVAARGLLARLNSARPEPQPAPQLTLLDGFTRAVINVSGRPTLIAMARDVRKRAGLDPV